MSRCILPGHEAPQRALPVIAQLRWGISPLYAYRTGKTRLALNATTLLILKALADTYLPVKCVLFGNGPDRTCTDTGGIFAGIAG